MRDFTTAERHTPAQRPEWRDCVKTGPINPSGGWRGARDITEQASGPDPTSVG